MHPYFQESEGKILILMCRLLITIINYAALFFRNSFFSKSFTLKRSIIPNLSKKNQE